METGYGLTRIHEEKVCGTMVEDEGADADADADADDAGGADEGDDWDDRDRWLV